MEKGLALLWKTSAVSRINSNANAGDDKGADSFTKKSRWEYERVWSNLGNFQQMPQESDAGCVCRWGGDRRPGRIYKE